MVVTFTITGAAGGINGGIGRGVKLIASSSLFSMDPVGTIGGYFVGAIDIRRRGANGARFTFGRRRRIAHNEAVCRAGLVAVVHVESPLDLGCGGLASVGGGGDGVWRGAGGWMV